MQQLGRHQLLGYAEERLTKSQRLRYRENMISDSPVYAPAGQPKSNFANPMGPRSTLAYYHYYLGDNRDQNVDRAPTGYATGDYPFLWFNAVTNQWVTDQARLGVAATQDGSGGSFSFQNLIKTRGAVLQSAFLKDRVIVTLGKRTDENYNKFARPSALKPNGYEFDFDAMNGWVRDWARREGDTTTKGVVVKPLRWLSLHYNRSDSFKPETPAISITLQDLPNPTSQGKDYGFSLNLWDGKLFFRANKYETGQVKSRAGQSACRPDFARLVCRVDFGTTSDIDVGHEGIHRS